MIIEEEKKELVLQETLESVVFKGKKSPSSQISDLISDAERQEALNQNPIRPSTSFQAAVLPFSEEIQEMIYEMPNTNEPEDEEFDRMTNKSNSNLESQSD